MKVREAIAAASARLAGVSKTPRLDAELLMAHALGVERETLLLSNQEREAPDGFEPLIFRREGHEPVAYITGRRAFWTLELEIGPGALIPRPDSETLIEAAAAHFGKRGPRSIVDLGTGPGTLLLAGLDQWPEARGLGVDRSEAALEFARRNAGRLGFANRAQFHLGDWGSGIEDAFDLVLCNPPYVERDADLPREVSAFEPPCALFAGADGLEEYRKLAPQVARLLAPQGLACIEIGAGQVEEVRALFSREGLQTDSRKDLGGHVRCVTLRH